jgi:hypothetical protein
MASISGEMAGNNWHDFKSMKIIPDTASEPTATAPLNLGLNKSPFPFRSLALFWFLFWFDGDFTEVSDDVTQAG